jgi:glycosyltransferase involved in cell wall biosynthesis
MRNELKIIGAAFGDPGSEGVFSGVAKYLFDALAKYNVMAGRINTCEFSIEDVFDGLLDWSKIKQYGRPGLNSSWVWRKKTVEKLSKRLAKKIDSKLDFNVFFQIGTHVKINNPHVRHFCLTDMTIAQAADANQFSIGGLTGGQVKEAMGVQREIFENCEGIFVNSAWTKNSIVDNYGQSEGKVHVVGVGASINPLIQPDSGKHAGHNILFVGRDWNRKGGPILVEAFRFVKERIKDARLVIIGTVPNIQDRDIEILGPLRKDNPQERKLLEKAFAEAAVFCVPSYFEPFGICFLEAQLCGLVPVTFEGQGRSDAIRDGLTGILVKEKTAHALSIALLELLQNPDKRIQMGKAGQEFVNDNFTWDKIGQKVLQVMHVTNWNQND